MTTRELLEAAARAAGIVGEYGGSHDLESWWNPLKDDGDALRLAVKLGIIVDPDGRVYPFTTACTRTSTEHAHHRDDPYAATRLAIVRAAAAIDEGRKT